MADWYFLHGSNSPPILMFFLKDKIYQFNSLPFSYSRRYSGQQWRRWDLWVFNWYFYMDDMLLMAESKQKLIERIQLILFYLRLIVNYKKTILRNQISGDDCEFHINGFEIARRENKGKPAGSLLSVKSKAAHLIAETTLMMLPPPVFLLM